MKLRTILFVNLLIASITYGESLWRWSPSNIHHRSVVSIKSGDLGSSGVQIQFGQLKGILTVRHGLKNGKATVTYCDGKQICGKYFLDRYDNDIAFIQVYNPTIPCLSIASQTPNETDQIEMVSYGGPKNRLRHFYGRVTDTDGRLIDFDSCVVPGDSGGPVLNEKHEVVSVIAHGHRIVHSGKWKVYSGSDAPGHTEVSQFLKRIGGKLFGNKRNDRNCPDGNCPIDPESRKEPEYYPPEHNIPKLPFDPVETIPDPPEKLNPVIDENLIFELIDEKLSKIKPKVNIDYQLLASMVITELKNSPEFERLKGPPGKDAVVDYEDLRNHIMQSIPPIRINYEGGQTVEVRPGGSITIPAVKMEIHTPEGDVLKQTRPLGEAIKIDLILEDNK